MDIKNKSIVITGGSDGLGLAVAKLLVQESAYVHIIGRDQNRLSKAEQIINNKRLITHQCDIKDYHKVESTVISINTIDILINNAGVWLEGNLEDSRVEEISNVIDTNLKGTIYVTRAVLPLMKRNNYGFILNVSSTSGLKGRAGYSVYTASKYGVTGFTEALKEDLSSTNIKVAGFYPGRMRTDIFMKAGFPKENEVCMDPNLVAKIVVFILTTDESMVIDHLVLNRVIK